MTIHTNILTLNDLITPNKEWAYRWRYSVTGLTAPRWLKSGGKKAMRAWGLIS